MVARAQRAKPQKVALTKRFIESLVCPAGKNRVYIFDTKTPALAICRTETGAASWYVYRRLNGKPVRVRLGGWPELTVENARDLAAEKNLAIANGIDPQAQKRVRREELTVGELFAQYLKNHASKKRTGHDIERMWDVYCGSLKGKRVSAVDASQVASLHARIGKKNGPYQANRVLEMLRSMFSRGVEWKLLPENPTVGVTAFTERSRERYLLPEEMPRFLAAVNAEPNETLRDFILTLLYTGQRRANVQAMKWRDISLQRAVWSIPATETKTGEPYTIALVEPAIQILVARQTAQAASENDDFRQSEFVFPGRFGRGHLLEPKGAWARILAVAKIENLRIHDLRRTLGSWQAAAGTSLQIIGKSLGHRNAASTAVYARLQLDPVRLAVNTAVQAMLATEEPKALPAPTEEVQR